MVDFPISVGYSFLPTDTELVSYYLFNKIETELPFNDLEMALVKECDLYGSLEPFEIWNLYGGDHLEDGQALYFFTRLKKVSVNDSRICRRAGSGNWAGEDSGDRIMSAGNVVGFKKRFRYENHGSPHGSDWIMHEFAIDSSLLRQHQNPDDDIVLCRMKKNLLSKKNKFKQYCFNSEPSKRSKIEPVPIVVQQDIQVFESEEELVDTRLMFDPQELFSSLDQVPLLQESAQENGFISSTIEVEDDLVWDDMLKDV